MGSYALNNEQRQAGAWVRVLNADGTEQAAVLTFGGFTFNLDRIGEGLPLVGDHEYEQADSASDARELVGLARHINGGALDGCHALARVTAALA